MTKAIICLHFMNDEVKDRVQSIIDFAVAKGAIVSTWDGLDPEEMAQFCESRRVHSERIKESLRIAAAAGRKGGRPRAVRDPEMVQEIMALHRLGIGSRRIARSVGLSSHTMVWRIILEQTGEQCKLSETESQSLKKMRQYNRGVGQVLKALVSPSS